MDLTLQEFCDVVCEAGVLVEEPGTMSYGHGCTIMGAVVEVCYNKAHDCNRLHVDPRHHKQEWKVLSEIMEELLFTPLGMRDATFFLKDGDERVERVPMCYGTDGISRECVAARSTHA